VPAFSDENTVRLINSLNETEELGQAVISWPEDWAESIRTSHAIQNQNGIKDLCPIDASNQPILAITHETDTHVAQISCHFVPGQFSGAAGTQHSSIRITTFSISGCSVFFQVLGEAYCNMSPSLILQMNPQEASRYRRKSNHQINRLTVTFILHHQQAFSVVLQLISYPDRSAEFTKQLTLPSIRFGSVVHMDILFSMGECHHVFHLPEMAGTSLEFYRWG
jgi:hypothetical protein